MNNILLHLRWGQLVISLGSYPISIPKHSCPLMPQMMVVEHCRGANDVIRKCSDVQIKNSGSPL